jgi:hypothetical protein
VSSLTLTSDTGYLVEAFDWARERALGWVQTGREVANLASYWAGYPDRPMFYSRDVCHQAVGAHLLGLDAENLTMIRHFAASANAARRWFPVWSFHFDGSVAALDYVSDDRFVREIPAVFDLTYRAVEQFRWTGDRRWIEDPVLWRYYVQSVDDFVAVHDLDGDGIPEASGTDDIFAGIATYNERKSGAPLLIAGDALALQFQALHAVAGAARWRGEPGAGAWRDRAASLQRDFLHRWWDPALRRFARGWTSTGPDFGFGLEATWFVPMLGLSGAGDRNEGVLDFLQASLRAHAPANIEAITYLPDVFFANGRDEEGWRWLCRTIDSRDDYPEVSYTVVHQTVSGLLGLQPDAPSGRLATLSHLPEEVGWLEVNHIPFGGWDLCIRQEGRHATTVSVNAGPGPLTVSIAFRGRYDTLERNGLPQPAETGPAHSPQTASVIEVHVEPGAAARVVAGTR